ncbi:hypothetical protein Aperf_G00000039478 [Anoplocephala perfoliata]
MASVSTIYSDQAKIHNENGPDSTALTKNSSTARPKRSSIRHVRFPEDDSIILGCLEPFHPTPDNCTSDELIAAYIASCKLYKAPPIDFLLEQLRGIDLSICNERYSRLCLRGIRMSRHQVETLEEVFRRVHFQEVDLEDTFLDEPSATALFDMMLYYETCVNLTISLNLERFNSSIAWPRCVTYLRKSGTLRQFKLSHTPLTANLFNGLSFSGLSLQSLTFRDCSLTGPALHYLLRLLRSLMNYTASSTTAVSSKGSSHSGPNGNRYPRPSYRGPMAPVPWALILRLPENRINALDAETLLLLVRHQLVMLPGPPTPLTPTDGKADDESIPLPTNKPAGGSGYLEELDLSHNSLRDDGVRILCAGLLQAYELQHRRLEVALKAIAQVTNPDYDPASAANITIDIRNLPPKCALPRARGLQRLNLADNALGNNGGVGGAGRHLAAVLRCSTERLAPLLGGLTFLDLSDNPGLGDGGVVELCEGLIRNFTMKELHLRNVKMQFDGAFALSGYIGETRSLVNLDIRQNAVDLAAIMAIARTLKVNTSLHSLQLDSQSSGTQTAEVNEMRQIFLKEISEYLRRNRNIRLQPEPDIFPEVGDENDAFSPNIKRAVERLPSPPIPDDINNQRTEEEEIQEILLDPPRPPGYISPRGSVDLDNAKINMPPVENGTPFVIESQNQPMQLEHAVRTPINPISDHPEQEMTTEEISAKQVSIDIPAGDGTKVPITAEAVQSEVLHRADESIEEPESRKLHLQDLVLSGEEATFKGLGEEPPMEFETFLKEQSEPTAETVEIPTPEKEENRRQESESPLDLSSAEADASSVFPQIDIEPEISQIHDAPVLCSASEQSDQTFSLQSDGIDPNRQTVDGSEASSAPFDDFKSRKEGLGEESRNVTSASHIEDVDASRARGVSSKETDPEYEISELQLKRTEKLSHPEEMTCDRLNETSEDRIGDLKGGINLEQSQPEIQVNFFADPEHVRLESPIETSYLTSDSNTLSVVTAKQEMSSSEDLLKEAMEQYCNAGVTLEPEESASATPEDFICQEVEMSESDDSLFSSSGHSPPKPTTEGVKVAKELEEQLSAESFDRAEACWSENEWDSRRPENFPASKTEQIDKPETQPSQVNGAQSDRREPETECDIFIEHSDEPPLHEEIGTNFSAEQKHSSEISVKESEKVVMEVSEKTVVTSEGGKIKAENDLNSDKEVDEPASLNTLETPDESPIEAEALDDAYAPSFRISDDKTEASNMDLPSFDTSESKVSKDITKMDYKGDELALQDGVELEKVESHVEPANESRLNTEFKTSSIGEKSMGESTESICETTTEKETPPDKPESDGMKQRVQPTGSTLQAMLGSKSDSKLEAKKDTVEIHEPATNETWAVDVSDVFPSLPEGNGLRTPDWTATKTVQPDVQLTEESLEEPKRRELDLQESASSGEKPLPLSEEATFKGLGEEPPMEFETFLKEQSEPTAETVEIPTPEGEGLVSEVLKEEVQDVEEKLKRSSEDLKLERDDPELVSAGESGNAKEGFSEILMPSVSKAVKVEPTDGLEVVNICSRNDEMADQKEVENRSEKVDFLDPLPPSLDDSRTAKISSTLDPLVNFNSASLEIAKRDTTDSVSFEKPLAHKSFDGSGDGELNQIQTRTEEGALLDCTTVADNLVIVDNAISSGSTFADCSKNNIDPSELESLTSGYLDFPNERPRRSGSDEKRMSGFTKEGTLLRENLGYPLAKQDDLNLDLNPQDKEPFEWEAGDQGDTDLSNRPLHPTDRLEMVQTVDQYPQIEATALTPIIGQSNDLADSYGAATAPEYKLDGRWRSDESNTEQISNQTEVPTEGTTEIDSDVNPNADLKVEGDDSAECSAEDQIVEKEPDEIDQLGNREKPMSILEVTTEPEELRPIINTSDNLNEEKELTRLGHIGGSMNIESIPEAVSLTNKSAFDSTVENKESNRLELGETSPNASPSNFNLEGESPIQWSSEHQEDLKLRFESDTRVSAEPGSNVEKSTVLEGTIEVKEPNQSEKEDWNAKKYDEDASLNAPIDTEIQKSGPKIGPMSSFAGSSENFNHQDKSFGQGKETIYQDDLELRPKSEGYGGNLKMLADVQTPSKDIPVVGESQALDPQIERNSPFKSDDCDSKNKYTDLEGMDVLRDDLKLCPASSVKTSKDWGTDVLEAKYLEMPTETLTVSKDVTVLEGLNLGSETDERGNTESRSTLVIAPAIHSADLCAEIESNFESKRSSEESDPTGFAIKTDNIEASIKNPTSPELISELENPAFSSREVLAGFESDSLMERKKSEFQEESGEVNPNADLKVEGDDSAECSAEDQIVEKEPDEIDQLGNREKPMSILEVTTEPEELRPIINTSDNLNEEKELTRLGHIGGSMNIESIPEAVSLTNKSAFDSTVENKESNRLELGETSPNASPSNFNLEGESPIQWSSEHQEDLKLRFESDTRVSAEPGSNVEKSTVLEGTIEVKEPNQSEKEDWNAKKYDEDASLNAPIDTEIQKSGPKIGPMSSFAGSSENFNHQDKSFGQGKETIYQDDLELRPKSEGYGGNLKMLADVQTPSKDIPVVGESQALDPQIERNSPFKSDDCDSKNKYTDLEGMDVLRDDLKLCPASSVKTSKDWGTDVLEAKYLEMPTETLTVSKDVTVLEGLNLGSETDERGNTESRSTLVIAPAIHSADLCAEIESNFESKRSSEESDPTGFAIKTDNIEASIKNPTSPELISELENPAFSSREVLAGFESDSLMERKKSEFQEESGEVNPNADLKVEGDDSAECSAEDQIVEKEPDEIDQLGNREKPMSILEVTTEPEELRPIINTSDNLNEEKELTRLGHIGGSMNIESIPEAVSLTNKSAFDSTVENKESNRLELGETSPNASPSNFNLEGESPIQWSSEHQEDLKLRFESDTRVSAEPGSNVEKSTVLEGTIEVKEPNQSEKEDWNAKKYDEDASLNAPIDTEIQKSGPKIGPMSSFAGSSENFNHQDKSFGQGKETIYQDDLELRPKSEGYGGNLKMLADVQTPSKDIPVVGESQALDPQIERNSPFKSDDCDSKNKYTDLEGMDVLRDDLKLCPASSVKTSKDWGTDVLEAKYLEMPTETLTVSKDVTVLEGLNLGSETDERGNTESRSTLVIAPAIHSADLCAEIESNFESKRSSEESDPTGFAIKTDNIEASIKNPTSPELISELENPAFSSREVLAGFESDSLMERKKSEFQEESAEVKLFNPLDCKDTGSEEQSIVVSDDASELAELSTTVENVKISGFKVTKPNSGESTSNSRDWTTVDLNDEIDQSEMAGSTVNTFSADDWSVEKKLVSSGDLSTGHPEGEQHSDIKVGYSIEEGKEFEKPTGSLENSDTKAVIPTSTDESGFGSKAGPHEFKVDDWKKVKEPVVESDVVEVLSRTPENPDCAVPSIHKILSNTPENSQEPPSKKPTEDWEAWTDF